MQLLVTFVCLLKLLQIHRIVAETVDVKTSTGTLRGQTIVELNKTLNVFLSVPYAEPPVGDLRFARPHPIVKPLPGIIDATKKRTSCYGGDAPNSEDCLFVNIWAPADNTTVLKAVMFWIYGGGFRGGSIFSEMYNGKSIAAIGDVVYVAVDYRLGSLGFLYGGDEEHPGNLGLLDQLLGLQWVRKNIHMFGGDKYKITVFGESAGSISVSALVVSPLAKGLFRRAILESGAHLDNRLTYHEKDGAANDARELAIHFKCTDNKTWLECLKKVSANDIHDYTQLRVGPLIGTEYLPLKTQEAFELRKFNTDVDLMAGVVKNEGSLLAPEVKGNLTEAEFANRVKSIIGDYNLDQVLAYYLKGVRSDDYSAIRWAYYDLYGDAGLKCSTYLFAKQLAQRSPNSSVYFYEQTYQSGGHLQGCDEKTMGICHGSDLEFVFYRTGGSGQIDWQFSREWITYWTNFAKTGVPTTVEKCPKLVTKADDYKTSHVKDMNPHDFKKILTDPFIRECDQFWKHRFN